MENDVLRRIANGPRAAVRRQLEHPRRKDLAMKRIVVSTIAFTTVVFAAGCGGHTGDAEPQSQTYYAQLDYTSPCTPSSCGAVPESLGSSALPRCAKAPDSVCSWSDGSSGAVSYQLCDA